NPQPGSVTQSAPEKFHWEQVESADYPTYIANLRSIGCPEQTIHDIIAADVHALHASRGEPQSFAGEEAAVVTARLGSQTKRDPAREVAPAPRALRSQVTDLSVLVPLVFQEADASLLKLDDRQTAVIAELREKFCDDLRDVNQNPNDPAYCLRWREAQRENDDL